MLLIDQFRQSKEWRGILGKKRFNDLADTFNKSMRFLLTEDICLAADRISNVKRSSLVNSIPLIRMPYNNIWIEFESNHRNWTADSPGTVKCHRVGFLNMCSKDSNRRGALYLFWSQKGNSERGEIFRNRINSTVGFNMEKPDEKDHLNLSPYCILYDFSDDPSLDDMPIFKAQKKYRDFNKELKDIHKMKEKYKISDSNLEFELSAARNLERRFKLFPNLFMEKFLMGVNNFPHSIPIIDPETGDAVELNRKNLTKQAISDWDGECEFFMAIIAFLNSHHSISFSTIDRSTINKKRRKLYGPPLYTHKLIHLKLTKTQQFRTRHMTGEEKRAHLVRGHFKVRKTGVFWWMPHIRGNMKLGFVDKDYELSA